MRRLFLALATALTLPGAVQAQSTEHPVVVELYTSQGCSSCPPADAVLAEIAGRKGVIALALHVDYWDYIGWKDTFGSKANATRQRAYAIFAGESMIYTPQLVVNGSEKLVGTDVATLEQLLNAAGGSTAHGPLIELTRNGGALKVRATSPRPLPDGTLVQLVRYTPSAAVAIKRGENAGRTITYTNIVTSWEKVATWNGQGTLNLDLSASGEEPAVVIIQEPGPGAILAAAVAR